MAKPSRRRHSELRARRRALPQTITGILKSGRETQSWRKEADQVGNAIRRPQRSREVRDTKSQQRRAVVVEAREGEVREEHRVRLPSA